MKPAEQSQNVPRPAPLVEVRRGPIVESRHRGHVAAVDGEGRLVASLGEPETITYLRSSAKPFQAIPLVTSSAADGFGLTAAELALACGSHSGEDLHAGVVAGMLDKIGLGEGFLKCGVHDPFDRATAERLRRRGESPGVLRNNCSGKHAGMLALARHLGAPPELYDDPAGPVQQAILHTVSQFSGVRTEEIALGTDGCGVPVFGLPVRAMALMYARLVAPPAGFAQATRDACARLVGAMTGHPELVGGTAGRFDTEVMRAARGLVVSKIGAEGVYTAGVLPCERWPKGLGLAFKIEDGEDRRARSTIAIESLRQLCVLDENAQKMLSPYASFPVLNHRGEIVGQIRPSFRLDGL
ncbi:MAG: asparaginase [Acidobacteria bacterium]|nr:asparaginase [Acidobacteriota bacterium]MCA1620729.1 asparaginase [Acidobacteriota bacterium]